MRDLDHPPLVVAQDLQRQLVLRADPVTRRRLSERVDIQDEAEFYAEVLGRAVDEEEFGKLDRIFHDAYRLGLTTMSLAADAKQAITSWPGRSTVADSIA